MTDEPEPEILVHYDAAKPFFEAWRIVFRGKDVTRAVKTVYIHTDLVEEVPVIELGVHVSEITTIGGKVKWAGLEEVPTQVLEQELNSRKEP